MSKASEEYLREWLGDDMRSPARAVVSSFLVRGLRGVFAALDEARRERDEAMAHRLLADAERDAARAAAIEECAKACDGRAAEWRAQGEPGGAASGDYLATLQVRSYGHAAEQIAARLRALASEPQQ